MTSGHGGLLGVAGEAGLGKTSLLDALADHAEDLGLTVRRTRCVALEQEFSFAVAVRLFASTLGESEAARGDLFAGAARIAVPILEGGIAGEPAPLFSALHGLYWLTANLASRSPMVLIVDDAHWADPSSLRFLNFLAARLEELPILLVVSMRPAESPGDAAALLDPLVADCRPLLRPAALTRRAVAELVGAVLPGPSAEFCEACAIATTGNPFLLRELLEELRAEEILPDRDGAERVARLLPAGLRQSVLVRLGQLGASAIALAKAVAVLSEGGRLRHLARLADMPTAQAAKTADALAAAGVLALDGNGARFAHPLIAAAVRSEIGVGERGRLHRLAAELLMADGVRPERVGVHLLHATPSADPAVVAALHAAAAEALSYGAADSAISFLTRALDEPPAQRAATMIELGHAQLLAGAPTKAVSTFELTLSHARPHEVAEVHHALGSAQLALGRVSEANRNFSLGATAAQGCDRFFEARNNASLITGSLLAGDFAGPAIKRLPEIVALSQQGDVTSADRAVLASAALVSVMTGRPAEEALTLADAALADGQVIEAEGPEGQSVFSVTGVLDRCGEYERDIEVLGQLIEVARDRGSVIGYATAAYCRSAAHLERGNLLESIADARAALDARRFGWAQYLPACFAFLTRALIERNELDAADSVLAEASLEDWDADVTWVMMRQARGHLAMARGDAQAALGDFLEWGARWPMPNPAFYADWRSSAAVAAASLGDREGAIGLATEELRLLEGFGALAPRGRALRALGLAQRGEEAIQTLRSAVEVLGRSEARLDHTRAVVDLGSALRRLGRRDDARGTLGNGVASAQQMGLIALEQRAVEELKLAGGRPRRRAIAGREALSAGELRVAGMAADGLTNRQIAQALFVTQKAVEFHLSNSYRKLNIGSRAQLAASLRADGATGGEVHSGSE